MRLLWEPGPRNLRRVLLLGRAAALASIISLALLGSGCGPGARGLPVPVAAAARTDTVTIDASEGTRLAFDLSPHGRTIVFDLLGQLWLLPAEGGEARAITGDVGDPADALDPAFSPDGSRIVFRSDRTAGRGLWLAAVAGGEPRRLTEATNLIDDDRAPAWSPDGRRIAFVRVRYPSAGLWLLDLATDTLTEIAIDGPAGSVGEFDWSPDGQRFVLTSGPRRALGLPPGRVWEVDANGGTATPLLGLEYRANSPSYSPDGARIAFFARDQVDNVVQLYVWPRGSPDPPMRLTDHHDTTPLRVRWSPDGESLVYSADGRLWRIGAAGGAPVEIPFRARLDLAIQRTELPPVTLAAPGAEVPARGHRGLGLSPDGTRAAWIALDKLWVFELGAAPVAIASVAGDAEGVAWSPDGREIAWSAGPPDSTDLFAANVRTGAARRLTALPGRVENPAWSPDGRRLAFLHTHGAGSDRLIRLRVIAADTAVVDRLDRTVDLGDAGAGALQPRMADHKPQWSPDGGAVLLPSFWETRLMSLEEPPRVLEAYSPTASAVRWRADGSLVYIQENAIWRAGFDPTTGAFQGATRISDAAISMSVDREGRVLYLSYDGLHLLSGDSLVQAYGWPVGYRVADAPPPLLIRDVHIIDGRRRLPGRHDVLVADGRIARIGPAGSVPASTETEVLEGGGRTMIPGLIDAHVHFYDDAQPRLLLASGITTVRDLGSRITQTAALREAIEAGVRPGPRIVFGGMQFFPLGFVSGRTTELNQEPSSADGLVRGLDLARGLGADYVKMRFPPDGATGARLIREANSRGMPVSGHIALPRALIAAGIDGMEHLGGSGIRTDEIVYDDVVQLFRAARLWVVPTVTYYSIGDWLARDPGILDDPARAPGLPPRMRGQAVQRRDRSGSSARVSDLTRRSAAILHRGGVAIAAGSDYGAIPWALHWELEELVAAGLSPLEAITAATATAAGVLGLSHELGTIEVGKRADLLVLDGDPSEDIAHTRRIAWVVKGGRVVEREALRLWVDDVVEGPPDMER